MPSGAGRGNVCHMSQSGHLQTLPYLVRLRPPALRLVSRKADPHSPDTTRDRTESPFIESRGLTHSIQEAQPRHKSKALPPCV